MLVQKCRVLSLIVISILFFGNKDKAKLDMPLSGIQKLITDCHG